MTHGWRNLAVILAVVCSWQAWRGCDRPARPLSAACSPAPSELATRHLRSAPEREPAPPAPAPPPDGGGMRIYGVKVPPWAMAMLPAPGEDLRSYRDRMLPLAQLAIAPHRARVARSRDQLVSAVGLDRQQQADLDATTQEAAQAIQDRLFNAVLSGEVAPATFKPMAAVTVARDVLDVVDRANKRFVTSLTDTQRTQLSRHPFDFGDYLLFSTRWEDAITGL